MILKRIKDFIKSKGKKFDENSYAKLLNNLSQGLGEYGVSIDKVDNNAESGEIFGNFKVGEIVGKFHTEFWFTKSYSEKFLFRLKYSFSGFDKTIHLYEDINDYNSYSNMFTCYINEDNELIFEFDLGLFSSVSIYYDIAKDFISAENILKVREILRNKEAQYFSKLLAQNE